MRFGRREQLVVVDPSQVGVVREDAAAHGVEVQEPAIRGIDPVTSVTLILVGTSTAIGVVLHLVDRRMGGQVVDLRPGAERPFFRTPDVIYGLIVIIGTDGSVEIEVKEPTGMFGTVLKELAGLISGTSSSKSASKAVVTKFGEAVDVRDITLDPEA